MTIKALKKASYKIPYGSKLYYDDGEAVSQGDKLADWDPFTMPIIVEKKWYSCLYGHGWWSINERSY